jgi:hypothetical protein
MRLFVNDGENDGPESKLHVILQLLLRHLSYDIFKSMFMSYTPRAPLPGSHGRRWLTIPNDELTSR